MASCEVSRTVRGKRALREQSIDVSSLRSKDGLFGGIALAPGDEFAYLLVADNPPIVRSGKGISPRRLRSARLKLAIIR